ncbi:MAG: hypothetical protein INR66_00075 [Gordonia polyisoprenivorans]|nr:hypothetical protein [Gordonia polyisoprenivorans]
MTAEALNLVDGITVPEVLLDIREHPEPVDDPPMWWVLGASGGAAASTLARWWAPAQVAAVPSWPAPTGESPYVVIAARDTMQSLTAAHALLRQWAAHRAGSAVLIGVVVTADRPRGGSPALRRFRSVVTSLAPRHWLIDYHPIVAETLVADLPVWEPGQPRPSRRTPLTESPPQQAVDAGLDIVTAIADTEHAHTRTGP